MINRFSIHNYVIFRLFISEAQLVVTGAGGLGSCGAGPPRTLHEIHQYSAGQRTVDTLSFHNRENFNSITAPTLSG